MIKNEELLHSYVFMPEEYQLTSMVPMRLYHKKLIGKTRFPIGYLHEDVSFIMEIFCKCRKAVYIAYPYYNYRMDRSGSVMKGQFSPQNLADLIALTEKSIRCLTHYQFRELAEYQFGIFYLEMTEFYMKDLCNESKEILKEYLKNNRHRALLFLKKENILFLNKMKILLCFVSPVLCCKIVSLYRKLCISRYRRLFS